MRPKINMDIKDKIRICKEIREDIVKHGYASGRGHISSSLSLVEVLVAIYFNSSMDINKIKEQSKDRDRIILSKGHAGLALFLTLIKAGVFEDEYMNDFCKINGKLATHPVLGAAPGIEMSAGSLGQGIGFSCGVALAAKLNSIENKVYVIVGDGELQEGSNWESMLFAAQNKLDNLILIIDKNGLQISGEVDSIISLNPLSAKLEAFGFEVYDVDGHDLLQIDAALMNQSIGKPKAIIANTVKGKGVSFIENKNGWHGKGLKEEEYKNAIREMKGLD